MILIRADANEKIGSGHIMRCMAIASALRKHGEQVLFVTADDRGDDLIDQKGFRHISLNTNWKKMEEELSILQGLITSIKPSLVLVDSYFVTEYYFEEINRFAKVAYMDDFGKNKWMIDYLINYNIYSTTIDYSFYHCQRTKLILGPKYTPLREEFNNISKHSIQEKIMNVVISAGGSDPERITEKFIECVCPKWTDVIFHFVVGTLNPRVEKLKELEKNNVVLHINERNMAKLMQNCDVAISAAGTTLYELCACGIPTITYILADNQILAANEFEKQMIMLSAGDCRNNEHFIENCNNLLSKLTVDKRRKLSINMQNLVDGCGAERIVEKLLVRH